LSKRLMELPFISIEIYRLLRNFAMRSYFTGRFIS
jgi:hypothetical protein